MAAVQNKKSKRTTRDIPVGSIKRLAKVAGCLTISELAIMEIEGRAKSFIQELVLGAFNSKQKENSILKQRDVETYLQLKGIYAMPVNRSAKSCRNKNLSKVPKSQDGRTKREQKSDCVYIPRASFLRVIKSVIKSRRDFNKKEKIISEEAASLIQFVTEDYLIRLLKDANNMSHHAKRVRVYPKDIQQAIKSNVYK